MKKVVVCIFILGICVGSIISAAINKNINDNTYSNKNMDKKPKISKENKIDSQKVEVDEKIEEQPALDYVNINIESGYNCNDVANLLYENGLISSVDDFKFILSIMKFDVYRASQLIMNNGVVSKGWQLDQLLKSLQSQKSNLSNLFYQNGLIDDQNNFNNFLNILDGPRYIIAGEKQIKKGLSMIEIVNIITQS